MPSIIADGHSIQMESTMTSDGWLHLERPTGEQLVTKIVKDYRRHSVAEVARAPGLEGLRSRGGEQDRAGPHGRTEGSGETISVRSGGIASAAATTAARVQASDMGTVLKAGCNGVHAGSFRCLPGGLRPNVT